jgi:hypothetical protein
VTAAETACVVVIFDLSSVNVVVDVRRDAVSEKVWPPSLEFQVT